MYNSLIYLKGNIFSSPAKVLVNPVNTFGVMGKGLAAEFKRRYPEMFKRYKELCDDKKFFVGQLILSPNVDYSVLLFPTKKHWRGASKLEYIEAGLEKFVNTYEQKKITSIAFPKLGCGYGGLNWDEVCPLMEKYLSDLPIKIYVYLDNEQDSKKDTPLRLHTDFSVDGVLTALEERLKKFSSLEFQEKTYVINLEDETLRFNDDKKKFLMDKTLLKNFLDDISKQNIFPIDKRKIEFILTAFLLRDVGYLSDVLIRDETGEFCKGFQLNRGALRILEKTPLPKIPQQISLFDK